MFGGRKINRPRSFLWNFEHEKGLSVFETNFLNSRLFCPISRGFFKIAIYYELEKKVSFAVTKRL